MLLKSYRALPYIKSRGITQLTIDCRIIIVLHLTHMISLLLFASNHYNNIENGME